MKSRLIGGDVKRRQPITTYDGDSVLSWHSDFGKCQIKLQCSISEEVRITVTSHTLN